MFQSRDCCLFSSEPPPPIPLSSPMRRVIYGISALTARYIRRGDCVRFVGTVFTCDTAYDPLQWWVPGDRVKAAFSSRARHGSGTYGMGGGRASQSDESARRRRRPVDRRCRVAVASFSRQRANRSRTPASALGTCVGGYRGCRQE